MDTEQFSLYIHVFRNGSLFILPSNQKRGLKGNLIQLKAFFQEAESNNGILLYSVEDSTYIQNKRVKRVLDLIEGLNIPTQIVDAHPEAYGYEKSFVPYLSETIEVAEFDVAGLKDFLSDTKLELKKYEKGSSEYQSLQETYDTLLERLARARAYLNRINSLYSELCDDSARA